MTTLPAACRSHGIARHLEYVAEYVLHGRTPGSVPAFSPDRVRRILVAHHYEIGDVLCITPSLRALRRAFPAAHLAVLVAENCRAVVERNPDVDEVFAYHRPKYQSQWIKRIVPVDLLRLVRDLRRQHFDLAVSMRRPYSNTNAWLAYVSGASWRLGFLAPASNPLRFCLNLGRTWEGEESHAHEVDAGLDLLASIGVQAAGRQLTLVPDPDIQAQIRERLHHEGAGGRSLAFVHISSRRELNRWPLAAFAEAADALHEKLGFSIVLSWAPGDPSNPLFPGDDGKAEEVAARMRTRPILLRTPTLAELIAAMSLSEFVLSPDGGCMHIAAALGIPQVALFGKSCLARWRPLNPRSVVLHGGGRADSIPVDAAVTAAENLVTRCRREASARSAAVPVGTRSAADAGRPHQPPPGPAPCVASGEGGRAP